MGAICCHAARSCAPYHSDLRELVAILSPRKVTTFDHPIPVRAGCSLLPETDTNVAICFPPDPFTMQPITATGHFLSAAVLLTPYRHLLTQIRLNTLRQF